MTINRIRMALGLSKATDSTVRFRGETVLTSMTGNPAYLDPPVELTALNTELDSYSASIAEALDGGKKAIAVRQGQREVVLNMLRLLGYYAEATCNNDPVVFGSSGFETARPTNVPPQPLPPAGIRHIVQGNSGQLVVRMITLPKVKHYELRYSTLVGGGTSGPWITETLVSSKGVAINGLTPGTTYMFQVRAFGKLGYTGWSDPAMRMCI